MKILVIGLGSMGKRRVRNLKALGLESVAGLDMRTDRRQESIDKYGIPVFDDLKTAMQTFGPQVFVISTPPDIHMHYAYYAFERGISCFIEASVVDRDKIRKLAQLVKNTDIIMAPSCTMRYYSGPKIIKELLQANAIGKVLNVNYHTGQYLPDWHPWEKIEEFYVSNRETGGAREIVPFELTWLNNIFGKAEALGCVKAKLTDISADIDDIYHCLLRYNGNVLMNLTVEVISRPKATREMRILGSEGELIFSADANCVRYINTSLEDWKEYKFDSGTVENQYINPEEPYIAEMKDFVAAVMAKNQTLYPNTLEEDFDILQTLHFLEKLAGGHA
jgi:predicted dehydrogenase